MVNETFHNPTSGETLKHTEQADGTRSLYVWKGQTTDRSVTHLHNILDQDGRPYYNRDFNRRVIADDRIK